MGICLSIVEAVDESVNDFLDRQSRYYKESKQAKEYAAALEAVKKESSAPPSTPALNVQPPKRPDTIPVKPGGEGNSANILQSDLLPLYPSLPNAAHKFHCRSVYDGDTLTLTEGSKVRLLGIDTPELKEKQPFALEAKEYTKKSCHGKDVWLTFQENGGVENEKNKDHYGRLLAFIWVPMSNNHNIKTKRGRKPSDANTQWLCINEGLVASGLAHVYTPSKSKKIHNHDKLLGLQKTARTQRCGQWKEFVDYRAVVTPKGGAFHKRRGENGAESDCKFLARSKSLGLVFASDAFDRGMHPCRNCFG